MSLSQLQREFNKLHRINTQSEPIEKLKRQYAELMKGMYLSWTGGHFDNIWRAQIGNHDNIKRMWYPPADKVTKLGRLNRKYESLFYACTGHNANLSSIEEVRAQIGDHVTQICCELTPPYQQYRFLGLGHVFQWKKEQLPEHIKTLNYLNRLDRQQRFNKKKDFRKNEYIADRLDTLFKQDVAHNQEHKYSHSIAITENCFENFSGVQGIIFPSIASSQNALNIVIKPNVADKFLTFKFVRVVEVLFKNNKYMKLRLRREATSIDEDGNFVWKESI
ncbi:MAG: hypothetical protein V2A75_11715 [Pseudomonadota bacterium]